ncbi:MAG: hypothetical protein RR598_00845 [Anaerorhabdus sp.]
MKSKERKLGPILKNILSAITVLAVVSSIAMPVYAGEDIQIETMSEPVQVETETLVEESQTEPMNESTQVETEVLVQEVIEETPVAMMAEIPAEYTVQFVLDNPTDGVYTYGTTEIKVTAGSNINLNLIPDFVSSGERKLIGWTINGQAMTGYANPYMYFMYNRTINENKVVKPVFGAYTEYTIQLGVKELNTGWLTGPVTFMYSRDIPFTTVFTETNFNQVEAPMGYYFKGWELNGVLYKTYAALSEEASKIQNQAIDLTAVFGKIAFTIEFFVDENSKGLVSFENGTDYIKFVSDTKNVNGYSVIQEVPALTITEGYEIDTWVFGLRNPMNYTQEEVNAYFMADDFSCNQYFTIKVKKSLENSTNLPVDSENSELSKDDTNNSNTNDTQEGKGSDGEEVRKETVVQEQVNNIITETAPELTQLQTVPTTEEVATVLPVTLEDSTIEATDKNESLNSTIITDEETPLAMNNKGTWALFNLLSMGLTIILAIFFLFKKNKENEEETTEVYYKKWAKVMMICIAVLSLVAFVLTENMSLSMVMVDKYTVVMFVIAVAQIVMMVMGKKKIEVEEKETLSTKA